MNLEKIKNIPKSPGVYHFLDQEGAVLYVGKAKNLKNRIRQYFLKELNRGPAIDQMVQLAENIKWIETDSEIEAVILEAELIKKLRPKYNIRLKDDKSFLMIKISKARSDFEKLPTVQLVRFKDVDLNDKTADYFGPYPAGLLIKKSLRYLRKIFPFRDCSKTKFSLARKKERPCLYGDLKICTAPCVNENDRLNYLKNVNYLKDFLKGKKDKIIRFLEKEMSDASKKHQFEEAASIRNKLIALYHIKDVALGIRDDFINHEEREFKRIECYDIANIGSSYEVGSMIVFTAGKPDTDEYRHFKIKVQEGAEINNDLERLKQVLERRFKTDWPKPDLVVIDGGPQQLTVANGVIRDYNLDIPAVSISKGPERKKNDFHFGNLAIANYIGKSKVLKNILISARDEAHRFAISYYRKLHRKGIYK